MHADVLVAEIGSTTTIVNAFNNVCSHAPVFAGQGQAATTVLDGDVTAGLKAAIGDLSRKLRCADISWDEMLATSSAAGGLRMTVHGLVYDMTARAAKEAALGAGAIVKLVTAGRMRESDLKKVTAIKPNIILVAGGVDYGERETALFNFERIASLGLQAPLIYAGNAENSGEIGQIAEEHGIRLYIVENVYPKVDILNAEPARRAIQNVFEEHIVHAPGMSKVRQMVGGPIMPTPGAVMEAAILLREEIGDLVVFDVGGATSDVHSVTTGSEEINRILVNPEPLAKRTVEGDLGVFLNLGNIVEKIGMDELKKEFPDAEKLIEEVQPVPAGRRQTGFIERMTREAVLASMDRHAGRVRNLYGLAGKKIIAEGRDLTNVKYIIGTGGALTRLPERKKILSETCAHGNGEDLFPRKGAEILIDSNYIMASLGVLSKKYPSAALYLLKQSLGL